MKKMVSLLAVLTLAACNGGSGHHDDGTDAKDIAVIAARTPDFSAGAISLVDADAPHTAQNNLHGASSDLLVRSGGDHYFVLERFQHDTITRYEGAGLTTKIGPFSTNDVSEPGVSSNPSDLVIASATKAYLLRYGSGKMWIVDPSATTEGAFKIGEIDLSGYDDFDGVPEMSAGIIRGGRLYVAMQRLENFNATKNAYVAVFDVATDAEVTTGDPHEALKGIELPVRNPDRIEATPDGHLLVEAEGGLDDSFNPAFDGGIARIDTATFGVTTAVDDGDGTAFGQIVDEAIVDDHRGYFIGSTGFFGAQTVYRFDPAGGTAPVQVTGLPDQLSTLAVSPAGQLFVGLGDDSAPGVAILGFSGGTETVDTARVDTALTPINIDFVTVETP